MSNTDHLNVRSFIFQLAKEIGADAGIAMITSPFSRKIFSDSGFATWKPVKMADIKDDEEGVPLFGDAVGPEVEATGHLILFRD